MLRGIDNLKKYAAISHKLPSLKAIVLWGEAVDQELARQFPIPVYSWESFLALGSGITDAALSERQSQIRPGHCASLIYTSGTTGVPKAVMLSHDNVTWMARSCLGASVLQYQSRPWTERVVSYLPLNHIAAQMMDIYQVMGAGAATYFAQPDALQGSLAVTLQEVRPTVFLAVPRIWEKFHGKIVQGQGKLSPGRKALFAWARGVCLAQSEAGGGEGRRGTCTGPSLFSYLLARALVMRKVKRALGLDCAATCITTAAPIAPDILRYMRSLDLPLLEIYGASECTGPHSTGWHGSWRAGYSGAVLPLTQSRIASGTGELLIRGRHVCMGYMYAPEDTDAAIDGDGWLRTGDIAELMPGKDSKGAGQAYIRITGRIKELIITAGGENISPVLVENNVKKCLSVVSNCMLVGDRRKFLSILLTVSADTDPSTGLPLPTLAPSVLEVGRSLGSTASTVEQMATDPLWASYFAAGVSEANQLSSANALSVKVWRLLPLDFSSASGELTHTLKLKRNVVLEKYQSIIDEIYTEDKLS